MQPPLDITCMECGGRASLITFLPEDGEVEPGASLAYRCADCLERMDVVMELDLEPD